MTPTTRRLAPFAVAAAPALTACGGGPGPTSTVTVTKEPTPEQQELTPAELTRALSTQEEVPEVFGADPGGANPDATSTRTTDPSSCLALPGVRIGDREHDLAVDDLWVRSGHNLINVSVLTRNKYNNEDLLESTAQGVLKDLRR